MSTHDRRRRLGRVRSATAEEARDPETLLRPDAVVAISVPHPDGLTVTQQRVASLLDGFRPVARVRTKSALTAPIFKEALKSLAARGALSVVAIVEEGDAELAGLAEESTEASEPEDGHTMPRATGDAIPPHVMAEIEAMIEEEVRLAEIEDAFEDATDVMSRPSIGRMRDPK